MSQQFNNWYQWQFIDSPPESDFCSLCDSILNEPMLTECCGIHFCKQCITPNTLNRELRKCFKCNQPSVTCILDKPKWRSILKLMVKCPFEVHGCEWSGEIAKSYDHLAQECNHFYLECTNGCGENLKRRKMVEHLENFCPKHQVTCKYCNENGEAKVMTSTHLLECPNYLMVCPHGCGQQLKQAQSDEHTTVCVETLAQCDYTFAGCDTRAKRKLMPQHLKENIKNHMHLQSKLVREKLEQSTQKFLRQIKESKRIHIRYIKKDKTEIPDAHLKKSLQQLELRTRQKFEDLEKNFVSLHEHYEVEVKQLLSKLPNVLWEVNQKELRLEAKIASGQFSEVWKGVQYGEKAVAVKKLKFKSMTPSKFLQEAFLLNNLEHASILTLLGVCTKEDSESILIIMEFVCHGDLLHFLKKEDKEFSLSQQASIIQQVASGMAYLESLNCVHRAVNSRSVLIGDNFQCKIGSFTLAHILDEDRTEYRIPQGESVPIKWSAPEVLIHNKCSTKSDVWSFGVLQYEVITRRVLKMSNSMATAFIKMGGKTEQPQGCPEALYELVVQCLSTDPVLRPSFASYIVTLQNLKLQTTICKHVQGDRAHSRFVPGITQPHI